jgi:hypothetical protein
MQGVSAWDSEDGNIAASAISHDAPVDTSKDGIYKVTYTVSDSDNNVVSKVCMVIVGDYIVNPGIDYMISGKSPIRLKLSEVAQVNADLVKAASVKAWRKADASPADVVVAPTLIPSAAGSYVVNFAVKDEPATSINVDFIVDDDRVALTYYANGATSGTAPASSLHQAGSSVQVSNQANLKRDGFTFGGWAFKANGGAAYQAGDTFNIYEDVNLYAVWTPVVVPPAPEPPKTITIEKPVIVPGPVTIRTIIVETPSAPVYIETPYEVPGPEIIKEVEVPKNPIEPMPPLENPGSWSLVSLLLAVFAFMAAAVLALTSIRRRQLDAAAGKLHEDESRVEKIGFLNAIASLLGLAPAVMFFVMDDITAPMVPVNGHTLYVLIAFVIVFALIIASLVIGRRRTGGDQASGGASIGYIAEDGVVGSLA